jgi:hypothetical protein
MGVGPRAPLRSGELFGGAEHPPTVSQPLEILSHGHPAKHRHVSGNVDPDDPDSSGAIPKHEGMVSVSVFVRVIGVVRRSQAAHFEQDSTADRVIGGPFGLVGRGSQGFPRLAQPGSCIAPHLEDGRR